MVLCAGVLATAAEWTDEDLERSFVLNYLSRYLLLRRLLPPLTEAPSGRVVLVANAGKYRDTLDLDDLQMRRGGRGLRVAGRTQFANDLLAVELAERLRDSRIEVSCVYPGPGRHRRVPQRPRACPVRCGPWPTAALQRLIGAAPAEAAQTPVFLADDPAATRVGGLLRPAAAPAADSRPGTAPDRRAALWTASEELVRRGYPRRKARGRLPRSR